jgi:hypothetical protein
LIFKTLKKKHVLTQTSGYFPIAIKLGKLGLSQSELPQISWEKLGKLGHSQSELPQTRIEMGTKLVWGMQFNSMIGQRRVFYTDKIEQAWRKALVLELERELRDTYPQLFTDELGSKLELRRERGKGWGTYVRQGVTLDKGELVGAYFGHVGSRSGPYSALLRVVTIKGRERWNQQSMGASLPRQG